MQCRDHRSILLEERVLNWIVFTSQSSSLLRAYPRREIFISLGPPFPYVEQTVPGTWTKCSPSSSSHLCTKRLPLAQSQTLRCVRSLRRRVTHYWLLLLSFGKCNSSPASRTKERKKKSFSGQRRAALVGRMRKFVQNPKTCRLFPGTVMAALRQHKKTTAALAKSIYFESVTKDGGCFLFLWLGWFFCGRQG